MMCVPVEVRESSIHGLGLFAVTDILADTTLYRHNNRVDLRIPIGLATIEQLHYGYVNPRNPSFLVICGDNAKFWNFPNQGEAANCVEGWIDEDQEATIVARIDIKAGEELLIDPNSDSDHRRKLKL